MHAAFGHKRRKGSARRITARDMHARRGDWNLDVGLCQASSRPRAGSGCLQRFFSTSTLGARVGFLGAALTLHLITRGMFDKT